MFSKLKEFGKSEFFTEFGKWKFLSIFVNYSSKTLVSRTFLQELVYRKNMTSRKKF